MDTIFFDFIEGMNKRILFNDNESFSSFFWGVHLGKSFIFYKTILFYDVQKTCSVAFLKVNLLTGLYFYKAASLSSSSV
jgi:hypothetical protein